MTLVMVTNSLSLSSGVDACAPEDEDGLSGVSGTEEAAAARVQVMSPSSKSAPFDDSRPSSSRTSLYPDDPDAELSDRSHSRLSAATGRGYGHVRLVRAGAGVGVEGGLRQRQTACRLLLVGWKGSWASSGGGAEVETKNTWVVEDVADADADDGNPQTGGGFKFKFAWELGGSLSPVGGLVRGVWWNYAVRRADFGVRKYRGKIRHGSPAGIDIGGFRGLEKRLWSLSVKNSFYKRSIVPTVST
ncbi:hypothetical protein GALMADRAFT_216201 [Galerina marginata CBS 339.88]|uniref:Uncharacterized protein n=1 Tax=Galerina marginata (strain CBS 339.88) TaxID=685588 RepID=A0A067SCX3_GALM3|nr:hypothetical protein GALMADRAFT_216201 [Galerina marginata CBS 339.88]